MKEKIKLHERSLKLLKMIQECKGIVEEATIQKKHFFDKGLINSANHWKQISEKNNRMIARMWEWYFEVMVKLSIA